MLSPSLFGCGAFCRLHFFSLYAGVLLMTAGALVSLREAATLLWGNENRTSRNRTVELLKCNNVYIFKDGKKFYIRRADLKQFERAEDE